LTLNLKESAGQAILAQLLAQADVFIQNLAPGAIERMGFGPDELTERFPRLIVCNISGYGRGGPYETKKAYDLLIQAEAGFLSVTGTEEEPSKAGISVADIAGGMYAFTGILTGLIARGQTGQGQVLDVSLFDGLCEWMGYPAYYARGGTPPRRTGAGHATIAPYGPFRTGDGGTIMLGIQNEREWARFCTDVLGRPALAEDERFASNSARSANRPALRAAIEAVLGMLSADDVSARLDGAGIANSQLRDIGEFWHHPQLVERDRVVQVDSPGGKISALVPPVSFSHIHAQMGAIPRLGSHTDGILGQLGYDAAVIQRLREQGVV
jgi:itaconate CoA-transferase